MVFGTNRLQQILALPSGVRQVVYTSLYSVIDSVMAKIRYLLLQQMCGFTMGSAEFFRHNYTQLLSVFSVGDGLCL